MITELEIILKKNTHNKAVHSVWSYVSSLSSDQIPQSGDGEKD